MSIFINKTLTFLIDSDALDVIMHLTFSNTLGFPKAGGDIINFMISLDKNLNKATLIRTVVYKLTDRADIYLI